MKEKYTHMNTAEIHSAYVAPFRLVPKILVPSSLAWNGMKPVAARMTVAAAATRTSCAPRAKAVLFTRRACRRRVQ
jgi:hypothetical protein